MLKLSDIVVPWLKETNLPLTIKESESTPGTWWIDVQKSPNYRIKINVVPGAIAAIVDNVAVPYVICLNTQTKQYEFFNAVDPEFFSKVEEGIRSRLKEYGTFETADTGHSS